MNYCQEFYVEKIEINPYNLFNNLNNESRAPFSALYRLDDKFCICASPERFLKKLETKYYHNQLKEQSKGTQTKKLTQTIKFN